MSAEASIPTFEDRKAMWESIDFPEHEWPHPAVDEYVSALRSEYANGSVLFRSFHLTSHPVLDWYLVRQLHDVAFFERFWSAPSPARFFRPADPTLNYFAAYGPLCVFGQGSPFHLAGDLAAVHFSGGAYSPIHGVGLRSKGLGDSAAYELLRDDYEQTLCYTSGIRWSDFFMDVAWDHTIIVISRVRRLIHCLLATDTD